MFSALSASSITTVARQQTTKSLKIYVKKSGVFRKKNRGIYYLENEIFELWGAEEFLLKQLQGFAAKSRKGLGDISSVKGRKRRKPVKFSDCKKLRRP